MISDILMTILLLSFIASPYTISYFPIASILFQQGLKKNTRNREITDCEYSFLGLAENRDGKVCAVLRQPFILSPTEASQDEISTELECLGFHKEDEGFYTNGNYDIFDAVPNNVLKGNDGHLYFIDTIIYESGTGGRETYNSLSPRARKI